MSLIRITLIISLSFSFALFSYAQLKSGVSPAKVKEGYENAYKTLKAALEDRKALSFKDAVFLTENTYMEGNLSYETFQKLITLKANFVKEYKKENPQLTADYKESDRDTILYYGSIFKIMTDTLPFYYNDKLYYHLPYRYDFNDFWGEGEWGNMFVSKLLQTQEGNCHSLPYLYKIIAEELGLNAYLALAPNHVYIKQWSKGKGWYNSELTSASNPIDAFLALSGYISLDAIRSRIYMDTLGKKESIALCVFDLTQGYKKKFGEKDTTFILKCCDLTLKYFPNCTNAILLKAELLKSVIERLTKKYHANKPSDLFYVPQIKSIYEEMEGLYIQLYKLGYRQVSKQTYLTWLKHLNTAKNQTNSSVKQ